MPDPGDWQSTCAVAIDLIEFRVFRRRYCQGCQYFDECKLRKERQELLDAEDAKQHA
ncbi:hypothetical protein LCGC14_1131410 [marine sediment metagenome]|uniref:Uncharacterized protein n=1 Tax=marine sediment metagenome TaxID=412755 RepID=A0A0F9Q6S5_9ZZZZ